MKEQIIEKLRGQKILILGFGREGKSTLAFLNRELPDAEIAIADINPIEDESVVKYTTFTGPEYLNCCKDYNVIIKAPGVSIKNDLPDSEKAKITSQTDLFLQAYRNQTIGITGTKGKSTTSSLIYHILQKTGKKSVLVGNIGKPCFDFIDEITPETIVVFEISAHQLEYVKASPHYAVLLNIYEEHFDHYATPEDYYSAKKNIFRLQQTGDLLVYGDIFQHATQAELDAAPSFKIDIEKTEVVPKSQIKTTLLGEHNLKNIEAAAAVAYALRIDGEAFLDAVASFQGLPHRLQYVGTFRGIKFYNDSIATAQEATINAVKAVGDVDTLILGGMDRGLDYHPLVEFLKHSNVRNILLLPDTGAKIEQIFAEDRYVQGLIRVKNMEEAVKMAYEVTNPSQSCLLSPAAASYGFYKDFQERGEDYCRLVNMLQ
ncbi:UDP-N-acetylmuramoyl-L-alanine--D-glutamate ligase [Candidatus Saccharibacteria bacterium]|nr:UDP-N-acetylmuramoyl-L-alanine--D-glutamate ligase [Candidatus Saccharibacteria bacterium]